MRSSRLRFDISNRVITVDISKRVIIDVDSLFSYVSHTIGIVISNGLRIFAWCNIVGEKFTFL